MRERERERERGRERENERGREREIEREKERERERERKKERERERERKKERERELLATTTIVTTKLKSVHHLQCSSLSPAPLAISNQHRPLASRRGSRLRYRQPNGCPITK